VARRIAHELAHGIEDDLRTERAEAGGGERLRHVAYAVAWKKLEPLWD
jgi:hypothetical protein